MPISHVVHEDLGIVVSSWVGAVSDDEVADHYRLLHEDRRWRRGFHELVDLRRAGIRELTEAGLRRLAAVVASHAERCAESFKTAIVAPGEIPFDLARVEWIREGPSGQSVALFRRLGPAVAWLDVDSAARIGLRDDPSAE
jgi:hypothetical protein